MATENKYEALSDDSFLIVSLLTQITVNTIRNECTSEELLADLTCLGVVDPQPIINTIYDERWQLNRAMETRGFRFPKLISFNQRIDMVLCRGTWKADDKVGLCEGSNYSMDEFSGMKLNKDNTNKAISFDEDKSEGENDIVKKSDNQDDISKEGGEILFDDVQDFDQNNDTEEEMAKTQEETDEMEHTPNKAEKDQTYKDLNMTILNLKKEDLGQTSFDEDKEMEPLAMKHLTTSFMEPDVTLFVTSQHKQKVEHLNLRCDMHLVFNLLEDLQKIRDIMNNIDKV